MNSFDFYSPTEVFFGPGMHRQTGAYIRKYRGTRVLIVYGGERVIKTGLMAEITSSLQKEGIGYALLGGVVPNPQLGKVYEGAALGRQMQADFLLAVGGGSVIDTAKAIAYALAEPDKDVWELFAHTRRAEACLPVASVLTIAAAGSETSMGAVITNERTREKRAYDDDLARPKFAVMNPELTLSLSDYQTQSGCVDIMMHTMERYFTAGGAMALTDALAEGLLRTVMQCALRLHDNPQDLDARSEIMWAGSVSHNGLTGCGSGGGDWSSHNLEHELGGMFGVTHGAGLAALWGSWARYVWRGAPQRFVKFARNVCGIAAGQTEAQTVEAGIRAIEDFFRCIGMPTSLAELGVRPTDAQIAELAAGCARATGGSCGSVKKLTQADMIEIYKMAK